MKLLYTLLPTPLLAADCWQPEGYARVRLLLRAGARADLCDVVGETLLHKVTGIGTEADSVRPGRRMAVMLFPLQHWHP